MVSPFKCWGSYLGLALGVPFGYFAFAPMFYFCEIGQCKFWVFTFPFLPPILGFLIGWGVHSLIKKIR